MTKRSPPSRLHQVGHLHFPVSDTFSFLHTLIQLAKWLQSRGGLSAYQMTFPFLGYKEWAFAEAIWKLHSNDWIQKYSFLSWRKKHVAMRLLRWHLFAFFYKQNGFIKKLLSNSSVFSPSELSSIRLPTGLDKLQEALLRLPLVHSLAQSTLPQQGSLSALNAPCFFFLSLPWALAQNWSSPTSMLPLSLCERLFLCRVLPNTAKVSPSLAAEVLKVPTDLGGQ